MNTEEAQETQITWRGVAIAVRYQPEKFGLMSHLELRTVRPEGAALPVTETGYRSHFIEPGTVENFEGGVVAYVTAWLEEEARSKEWQKKQLQSRQPELF